MFYCLKGEKRKFVRINLLLEFCLFVWVMFWNKKYIFSYTFDLCGRVGDKENFTRPISANKTTFFGAYNQLRGDHLNIGLLVLNILIEGNSQDRNVAGINHCNWNLVSFATFPSCDNLLSDLPRHLIPVTFSFFKKLFFLLSHPIGCASGLNFHFSPPTFAYIFFSDLPINCKIFVQLSTFLDIFHPFQQFATLIPATFWYSSFYEI